MARYTTPAIAMICLFVLPLGFALADELTFERHIRPILKTHCFHCHGEEGKREGGLDLRLRRLIAEGGDSGVGIVPGEPAKSRLLARVRDGEMPPIDKKLTAAEISQIEKWIGGGAKTTRDEPEIPPDGPIFTNEERDFWSLQSIRRPEVPTDVGHRVRTPIDGFVLARLAPHHLDFSADADRRTLIRRVYFDLIGLPPPPDAVESFLADESPAAYQRLLDELLSSPAYGERWGRHWLDVAGYADSEGYTDDDTVRPWAFRYRDYVIAAFNLDMPFDQFIHEQLAGDELASPPYANMSRAQTEKLTATGFLRMVPDGTGAGGLDQDVARNEVIADTIKVVSTALMGLSVGCARCHNHRYDPIPTADYYRLRAIFEPAYDWKNWRTPAARRISLYTAADRQLAAKINAEAAEVDQQREQQAQQYIDRTLEEELATLELQLRDPLRAAYKTPAKDRTDEQKALLKEHPSVANISAGSLYLYDRRREERARQLDRLRVEKEQRFIENTKQTELAKVPEQQRPSVLAAAKVAVDKRSAEQQSLLRQYPGAATTAATLARFNPEAAAELQRDRQAASELRSEKAADDLKRYQERADEIRGRIPKEHFVRALTETPDKVPATFVFYRGDHGQPKDQAFPAGLSILETRIAAKIPGNDPQIKSSGRRLAFARRLTDPDYPLTARVVVNRIWMHHFGRGIVNTPSDFGYLGDRPTHPQLLDWLAAEFIESGWQVKRLHKLIMMSTVYRQSSHRTERHEAIDPDNRLYARMSIRRLESEVIRDAMLAVSGTLNEKLYGEAVPVMEDEVGQIVIGKENLDGERKPGQAISLHGEEFRRSIYVQVRRSRPLGVLETFDNPAMTPNCDRRNASNVAPQSLLLMNSKLLVEYSNALGQRVAAEAGTDLQSQIEFAWQLVFASDPNEDEVTSAFSFIQSQQRLFATPEHQMEGVSAEQQAIASFCQALMSSNRFIYVE